MPQDSPPTRRRPCDRCCSQSRSRPGWQRWPSRQSRSRWSSRKSRSRTRTDCRCARGRRSAALSIGRRAGSGSVAASADCGGIGCRGNSAIAECGTAGGGTCLCPIANGGVAERCRQICADGNRSGRDCTGADGNRIGARAGGRAVADRDSARPVAWELLPAAKELPPLAVTALPNAVELVLLAFAAFPMAVDEAPRGTAEADRNRSKSARRCAPVPRKLPSPPPIATL